MSDHAILSPSASERWLNCGAAPHREADVKDRSSEAAEWGTAAHAMAEHCLTHEVRAEHAPERHPLWHEYDGSEMRDCVQQYLDFVHETRGHNGILFVEQALQIFPDEGVWGTADTVVVNHEPGLIDVIDLKGGTGVLVDAEKSDQLRMYGLGALQSLDWLGDTPIDRVRVTIVQPRREHRVSRIYTAEELLAWRDEVLPKVRSAFRGDAPAVPGEWCRWCRVRATCEERREFIQNSAAFVFADGCKPEVKDMNEDLIVKVFLTIPLIEQYIKDIETWVADQSHDRGHALAGLKWVEGRATRYINDTNAAAQHLKGLGIEPYEAPKLLGITAIERALKKLGMKVAEALPGCVSIKLSDPVLVAESDPREPFDPNAGAKNAFKSA